MKYSFVFKIILQILFGMALHSQLHAQIKYQTYSYDQQQKYSEVLYSPQTRLFTSSKNNHLRGELLVQYDSIVNTLKVGSESWVMRKLFNEHLVQVEKEDHTFYLDFLPDFGIGADVIAPDTRRTWINTRGFQAGLTIKDKFSLYINAFENQAVFPDYLTSYSNINNVVPGQGTVKNQSNNVKDWMYATANLMYDINPYLQVTLAYDKNHIGDGYRSVLLSDFSSNYAHLRLTGQIGNVQYTSIWAYMNDPRNPRGGPEDIEEQRLGDGIKWGAFQYLDYNATNRLSVGFFQSVIWANRNQAGYRGFDFHYAMPVSFMRPIESNNSSSPDKMFLGLNAKYKVLQNATVYGQFMLGEFTAKEFFANNGYIHNKWGAQIGARAFNIFGIKNLNILGEYNLVRPYMYQHFVSISNYSNHGEPLAHPRGANFRELVGIANYGWKRLDVALQGVYSLYGTDPASGENMGGDIFQSYRGFPNAFGNKIGQGVRNNLYYLDARLGYVLNPSYNLRIESSFTQRYNRISGHPTEKSGVFSIGLRSTFRPFYKDI